MSSLPMLLKLSLIPQHFMAATQFASVAEPGLDVFLSERIQHGSYMILPFPSVQYENHSTKWKVRFHEVKTESLQPSPFFILAQHLAVLYAVIFWWPLALVYVGVRRWVSWGRTPKPP